MDSTFVSCLNNSLLVQLNTRKKKRIRVKSYIKLPELDNVDDDKSKIVKYPTNKQIPFAQPIQPKKEEEITFDFDISGFDADQLNSLLHRIVQQELRTLKSLQERAKILTNMNKIIETSQTFTEKDAQDLMTLTEEMSKTILNTSEIEIELGIKIRQYEKKTLELAVFKNNSEIFHKRCLQAEHELKELREKIKNLQEENIKQVKINENEKHRYYEASLKTQKLEESLWALSNSNTLSPQDSLLKLKGAISALLKEAYQYKKEIQNL
jgi:hypothetical protein